MLYTSTHLLIRGFAPLIRIVSRIRDSARIFGAFELRSGRKLATKDAVGGSEPRRLTLAEQWNYLSDTITGALSQAEKATRCHKSAALQLDLAQYALSSLVDELSAVMDVGGRRREATVHLLDVQPPPSAPRPFGDAIAA